MIKFTPSIPDDQSQILEWILADPYHQEFVGKGTAAWWLTGNSDCLLATCIEDKHGPVVYIRLDQEDDLVRLHVQFGPECQVSKRRVVRTITEALPPLKKLARKAEAKGFIFESISPSLIKFMCRLGFVQSDEKNYMMMFEEK